MKIDHVETTKQSPIEIIHSLRLPMYSNLLFETKVAERCFVFVSDLFTYIYIHIIASNFNNCNCSVVKK